MKFPSSPSIKALAALVALGANGAAPAAFAAGGASCRLPLVQVAEVGPLDGYGSAMDTCGDDLIVGATGLNAAYVFRNVGGTWQQQAKLVDPSGTTSFFGLAVAVDGDRAAVSSTQLFAAGPVHIFERSGGVWTLVQTLLEPGLNVFDGFGQKVALSGDDLMVSGSGMNGGAGAIMAYRRQGGSFQLIQTLTVPGGGRFGSDVAIQGDVAVVGAAEDDTHAPNAGAVYAYQWGESSWKLRQKLTAEEFVPNDANAEDRYGTEVALSGDFLFVGAPFDDDGGGTNTGSVFVAERTAVWPAAWAAGAELHAPAAFSGDRFGAALHANRIGEDVRVLVGAPSGDSLPLDNGAAYVFRSSSIGTGWSFVAELRENCIYPGYDSFAEEVVLTDQLYPLVGAPGRLPYPDPGRVFAFSTHTSSDCFCPCTNAAHSADYGAGKPGLTGTPTLTAFGAPLLGQKSGFTLANALPGAPAFLFLGLATASVPFDEGTLLVQNPIVSALPAVPPSGSMNIFAPIPDDTALCGLTLYHQVMVVDPAATGFYHTAQTAGLERTFGS